MARDEVFAQVSGLREIRRDLISADRRYGPEIRKVLKGTAEIVAIQARSNMTADGAVLSGAARKSIKAATSGPNAVIRGGSKKVPYYGWLDFGGTIRPKGAPIERPVIKSADGLHNGRYIYLAIKKKMAEAVDYLQTNLSKLILKGEN